MSFNRRPGGRRPDRPDRPDRGPRPDRFGGDRPDRFERPERRGPPDWAPRDARPRDRGPQGPRRFDRRDDEGGMSIRLDPRRLTTLKRLAAEAGMRPGELAVRWIEERIDGERAGAQAEPPGAVAALAERVSALEGRIAALAASAAHVAPAAGGTTPGPESGGGTPAPRRRGRPPKADAAGAPPARRRSGRRPKAEHNGTGAGARVALHDEISAVIAERGPTTAADIAAAITERGRYAPPRSGKALTAATVNSRVSNPIYRSRFVRGDGRIGLAAPQGGEAQGAATSADESAGS